MQPPPPPSPRETWCHCHLCLPSSINGIASEDFRINFPSNNSPKDPDFGSKSLISVLKYGTVYSCIWLRIQERLECATFFGVRNRNSATWRKHFRNRNSATFNEMLLRNRNSAIPQSQFFLKSATWELQFRNFRQWNSVDSWGKKIGSQKSHATVPLRQVFGFQRNRGF